jgi:hypothetical protein
MSDIFDQASDLEAYHRDAAIAYQRHGLKELPDVGICYFCHSITPPGHRFCDTDCRDDYQAEQKQRRASGS